MMVYSCWPVGDWPSTSDTPPCRQRQLSVPWPSGAVTLLRSCAGTQQAQAHPHNYFAASGGKRGRGMCGASANATAPCSYSPPPCAARGPVRPCCIRCHRGLTRRHSLETAWQGEWTWQPRWEESRENGVIKIKFTTPLQKNQFLELFLNF